MNLLTKNRILEKGDEYKDPKGDWLTVPDKDIGLQIMFSPYTEVRRPSEPSKVSGDGNVTLVPPPKPTVELPAPKPLSGDTDTHSRPAKPLVRKVEDTPDGAKSGLPTVISTKAHKRPHLKLPEPKVVKVTAADKLIAAVAEADEGTVTTDSFVGRSLRLKNIIYPKDAKFTKWIGRNGTFRQIGLRVAGLTKSGFIRLRPIGKRGIAKNAVMEIPMASVPALIDALKEFSDTRYA